MDFSDALKALKEGKAVQREVWTRGDSLHGSVLYLIHLDDHQGIPVMPQLMIRRAGEATWRPFAGANWDLLADDWKIAE